MYRLQRFITGSYLGNVWYLKKFLIMSSESGWILYPPDPKKFMIENFPWRIGPITQTNAVSNAERFGRAENGALEPLSPEVFSSLLLGIFSKFLNIAVFQYFHKFLIFLRWQCIIFGLANGFHRTIRKIHCKHFE